MNDTFTWRGLLFERAPGGTSTAPFHHGHWSVWRPKTIWSVSWISDAYEDVETGEEDDPTGALERLLARLQVRLQLERQLMAGLQRMLKPHEAACEALVRDLEAVGVPVEP